eukprot:TRINITY_DN4158_c0_g1_i1.p1 TRINITY_DN4158_c0_g1~~TRINITY_DN4158_c0_g1_i1.p1  ORF type:complete len:530 (+),score=122.62 TRINITY_DN4158_c0_g1_i1:55-1644(+)
MLTLLAGAAVAGVAPRRDWVNVTVFRLTPINYTGVTNMDTADAPGDVMFGLNQLLLPVLCRDSPSFLWCQNRQYLSGGSAKMVYTQFTVNAEPRFGDYAACNPNRDTGIFGCQHWGADPAVVPSQCRADFAYEHNDCLNGTIYRTFAGGQGDCCDACREDAVKCRGWYLHANDTCNLLTDPIVTWQGAQADGVKCKAAEFDQGFTEKCWYDHSEYSAFADVCDRKQCSCPAVELLSLGVEYNAMCFIHHKNQTSTAAAPASPAFANLDGYWGCGAALFDHCYESLWAGDAVACSECAAAVSGCSDADVKALCHTEASTCAAAVHKRCGTPVAGDEIGPCRQCAFTADAEAEMRAAGCNSSLVNSACGARGSGFVTGKWGHYLLDFACHMNGTWYSTQGPGKCNTSDPSEQCWWNVVDTVATKNQSCVDDRVVSTVRRRDTTGCWAGCPQPNNQSTACYLDCLFTTMLGNETRGIPPTPASVLTEAFENAFKPESQGGCPEIVPPAGGRAVASPQPFLHSVVSNKRALNL